MLNVWLLCLHLGSLGAKWLNVGKYTMHWASGIVLFIYVYDKYVHIILPKEPCYAGSNPYIGGANE